MAGDRSTVFTAGATNRIFLYARRTTCGEERVYRSPDTLRASVTSVAYPRVFGLEPSDRSVECCRARWLMFRIRWGNSVLTREAPGDVQCLSDVWVNERKPRERGGGDSRRAGERARVALVSCRPRRPVTCATPRRGALASERS